MKIMILSSSPTFTGGYGVIADYLGRKLIDKGVSVSWIGVEYQAGQPIEYYKNGKIYAGGDMLKWGQIIKEYNPDILLHIRDNWVFTDMYNGKPYTFKEMWKLGLKQINYTPIQAIPVPDGFLNSIEREAHLTLIDNKWGMDWAVKNGINPEKIDYLYHGVDRNIFNYRPAEKHEGKRFIFVGTNFDKRKNIPFLLKAFKEYKDRTGDEKSKLYLHTNMIGTFDLPFFIQGVLKLKIGEDIILKEIQSVGIEGGLPTTKLVDWYNWADVYTTATFSEGFNIPLLEAMSVGLSAVATDFPVHREIFGRFDRIQFVKSYEEMPTNWSLEWMCDLDDFVEAMIKAGGKEKRDDILFKEFEWDYIADRFLKIIDEKLKL